MSELDRFAQEVLSQLELKETKLLSWGFHGGNFPIEEYVSEIIDQLTTPLLKVLWAKMEQEEVTKADIITNLTERKLLFSEGGRGRTRYAETIRLLFLMKQRFSYKDWQSASNLVSNIKMNLKYRKYPKRDQDWGQIETQLKKSKFNPIVHNILFNLLEEGKISLSTFQLQSTKHLLGKLKELKDSATIIGAGTGSGKTKAFYLPAFTYIIETFQKDPTNWTKVLAIYPRVELLKDQLKEALSESRKLIGLLNSKKIRPVIIGTYFGNTPYKASDIENSKYYSWEKVQNGYVCPYLTCPECSHALIWKYEEYKLEIQNDANKDFGKHEILNCTNILCRTKIDSKQIMLTRKRMDKTPPDILFTTTEMLNRKLSNLGDQHIFGVKSIKPPKFILLDEVHIHEGVTGAHVSFVLKRWRHLVRIYSPKHTIQFIGLSATLTNPKGFFSQLVGLPESSTTYITPAEEDMVSEGIEYNIVLRGDPMSATSLLSTSVQTAMLVGRILDPLKKSISRGAWGSKVFGFTDKLDVINRWYHIEKDAEKNNNLAQYRRIDKIDPNTKKMQIKSGQIWPLIEQIDPMALKKELIIGVTSSQSRGVDSNAKLVIATSTLEVGFNDPNVGAVIQHKSPRNMASFLQRKGRAGRLRGMRPWMIVVTSAYGRDRWIYDNPEQIFSPVLPELNLPLRNTYIQHIQAGYILMDWLGVNLNKRGYSSSNLWFILSPKYSGSYQNEKKIIIELLTQVLSGNNHDLFSFIEEGLLLDRISLSRVLWSPPRSIIFELIPSLLSQLNVDWKQFVQGNEIINNSRVFSELPLSGFIPRNLFSNIEISDLELTIPGQVENETLGLRQGLFEFAPGNVSRRYKEAHWIPAPEDSIAIDLEKYMDMEYIGNVEINGEEMAMYSPKKYVLNIIPKELSDRSTGYLKWRLQILPKNSQSGDNHERIIKFQSNSPLSQLIQQIEVFTHENNDCVILTRFAFEVSTEKKYAKKESELGKHNFTFKNEQVAIGLQVFADCIAIYYEKPDLFNILYHNEEWDLLLQEVRPSYYLHLLKNNDDLQHLSVFEIEWLCQITLSSVVAVSISMNIDIEESIGYYQKKLIAISLRTLKVIFQVVDLGEIENEEGKLQKRLLMHLENETTVNVLLKFLSVLYEDVIPEGVFWEWLRARYISTIASAFKEAVGSLLPDLNTDDLLIDIDENAIWLSEPESGGMGVISQVVSGLEKYKGRFEELFIHSISHCNRHEIAKSLDEIIGNINYPTLTNSFSTIRNAVSLVEQEEGLDSLQKSLYKIGIPPQRELIVSLCYKLLNSNSSLQTDELAYLLHSKWHEESKRMHCKIDSRVFTVAVIQLEDIREKVDQILVSVIQGEQIDNVHRYNLVESLLWSNCLSSCPDCLQIYNPYSSFAEPAKLILKQVLNPFFEIILYGQNDWENKIYKELEQYGKVKVSCEFQDIVDCRAKLMELIQQPIEVGFELLYPFIEKVNNSGNSWYFDIRIREVLHA